MVYSDDELAGIVDLFGTLTRDQLRRACLELYFRETGDEPSAEALEQRIDEALAEWAIVEHPTSENEPRLTCGPMAFPFLPEGGQDLPHILDVDEDSVDRTGVAMSLTEQIHATLDEQSEPTECSVIRDRVYALENWAGIELPKLREQLRDD